MSETFEQSKGLPANEHAKKIAKAESKRKSQVKEWPQFFTLKDGKILSVKVKPTGAYSSYVGKKTSMMKSGDFNTQVAAWKKQGVWISEEDFDAKISELIAGLK